MSQSGSEVLRGTADPGPSITVQSSRLWALRHGRFTKLLFPTHLKADRSGITLVNVEFWLAPWAREEEHTPMSHLAEVDHDRGLLWNSVSIESSGGLNPLQVQGLPKGAAERARRVSATREVILSAGTIHTAQLLMLSGVGEASELKKLGIAPVADLRSVGRNFQDHVHVSGVVYQCKGKFPDRPADSNAVEAEVNLSSGVDGHGTDIILVLEQLPNASPELAARFGTLPENCFTISPSLVQPTSRGQVSLASADCRVPPTIEGNFLGTDRDLKATLRAAEAARELVSQKAFDAIREAELIPGQKAKGKQDLIDFVRTGALSFGHPIGTARLGNDADAVVDSELRVHGVRGLRVADASGMPSIISGATNAPSIMIGGRAAEFIRADNK